MKFIIQTGSIISMLLFIACTPKLKNVTNYDHLVFNQVPIKYAQGFRIFETQGFKKLIVENPWQKAKNVSFEYILSTDTLDTKNIIKIPIKKAVCLSTTHLAYICALNAQETVLGITNSKLVSNKIIQEQLTVGNTLDIGNEQALNYETILSLNPDVIFAYGVGAEVQSVYQKFADWGLPVVVISEYLEESPLAKTEWLKFFSCFYDNSNVADSLFSTIEFQYTDLTTLVKDCTKNPAIMSSLPWKGVWYTPGGKSFMANFISDAGGNYLYKTDQSRESLSLTIEKVMLDGQQADIWVNTGMTNSLIEIEGADNRLTQLPAYKNKMVFNNNRRQNAFGGNDFWESGVMNPHLILKDLIQIFHPEIINDTCFYYYQKLN